MSVGGMLAVSCAILWALGDLPLDKPTNEPAKPTLAARSGKRGAARTRRAAQGRRMPRWTYFPNF
jgi:hypothetical protein